MNEKEKDKMYEEIRKIKAILSVLYLIINEQMTVKSLINMYRERLNELYKN